MKNLKKLVSVIVTLAMLISSFAAIGVSASYADVDKSNSYYKAIEVLSGLGVVKGDDEGNFNPTSDIKRSEMVALICRAKGEEAIAQAAGGASFADVAADHWAAGYIAWGVASDIIKGVGDNKFDPDASVKFQDAVVMVLRALGYERIAQRAENGGYPTGYLKVAGQKGVLANASAFDGGKAATREIVAQVIYNAMTTPLVDVSYYAPKPEDDEYVVFDGKNNTDLRTLLTYTNEIYKVKATVLDTAKTQPAYRKDPANPQVKLHLTSAYDYAETTIYSNGIFDILGVDGSDDLVLYAGDTNVADYFGYTVEAYIAEDEELDNWKLLAVVVDSKSVSEETLVAADVTFEGVSGTTFAYIDANNKDQEVVFVANPVVYYNGVLVDETSAADLDDIAALNGLTYDDDDNAVTPEVPYTAAMLFNELLVNVADEITFKGPRNADYDTIYVTDYAYLKATEILADELVIKYENAAGSTGYLELDKEARNDDTFVYEIYDAEGAAITVADIAEDDILNIVAPIQETAGTPVTLDNVDQMVIYVTNEVVEGEVDEVDGAEFYIGGNAYTTVSGTPVANGKAGVFYLTMDGKVFSYEADSTVAKNLAFIVGGEMKSSFGENTHYLQLFTSEGKLETFTIASTVKVVGNFAADGTLSGAAFGEYSYKRSDGTQNAFFGDGDGAATGALAAGTIDELYDADTAANVKNDYAKRVVAYRTNSNGEINALTFANAAGAGVEFEVNGAGTMPGTQLYNNDINVFGAEDLDDSSILFAAPTTGTGSSVVVDKDKLAIISFDSMDPDKTDGYNAYSFTFAGEDTLAAAITPDVITSSMKKAHLAVVQSMSNVLDAEKNPVVKYTFVQSGEIVSLTVDADASIASLNIGDVFRYAVNAEGNIEDAQLIYDASAAIGSQFDNTHDFNYTLTPIDFNANKIALVFGRIVDIKDGKMTIDNDGGVLTDAEVPSTALRMNATEGNTYASIDEARLATSRPETAVKALKGNASLKASYNTTKFYVVAIVSENNRFEDCVMIIK